MSEYFKNISKIKIIPTKPIIIDKNLIQVNLSSEVNTWDISNVIKGPTDINKPAVEEGMYCSAQLIR